jgi:uncharacterized Zn finger protein
MVSTEPVHALLSDGQIRKLAGDTYYKRGVDYFRRELVQELDASDEAIGAIVCGTEDYEVEITFNGRRIGYTCTCPLGDDGLFCKHLVATGLAWLATQAKESSAKPARRVTDEDIKTALGANEKETLIAWLVEWSREDKALRQRLTTLARLHKDPATAATLVREQLREAIQIRGYLDYHEAPSYAARVDDALDAVETLLKQGNANEVIGLCETAMNWLDASIEKVDDSDGQGTELMGRVADLHLLACEQARPDPAVLGARLFSLEMKSSYSQWEHSAERYAHLLGECGLATFREAALKEWAKVPTRTISGDRGKGESYYGITGIMQSLAEQSGDVEQLVAVLERDLTFAGQYERIAVAYREAGNHEKALHWAERGIAIYPGREGAALRRLVADEYRRQERHGDALRILWTDFRAEPSVHAYKILEDFARAADDWDDWRERAIAHIRRTLATNGSGPEQALQRWIPARGHSLLVEVFLHEQNIEQAWQEAQAGGCIDALWLQLAALREQDRPADAAAVYLRLGDESVTRTSDGRYELGIALLERAAALMHRVDRSAEFQRCFDAIRQRLKNKRNLQKLAEARRNTLYL